jgi:hypothetical protein
MRLSADENTMLHLAIHRTLTKALPASRQGRYPACVLNVSRINLRSEHRELAE